MKGREQAGCRAGLAAEATDAEQGFMLLGLIVAMAIILLVLGVAASEVAYSLRREKEEESARRADQYVRAIAQFYRKNNHYPGSLEQLENTNRVRYLRQRYVDPLTGGEYRIIAVGKNKTTVKGFFGQPLGGLATAGPGAGGGAQATGTTAAAGGVLEGKVGTSGKTDSTGGPDAAGTSTSGGSATPQNGTAGTGANSSSSTSTGGGIGGGGSGPIVGVGSNASGSSILTFNEQTSYDTWEFLYDPRVEQLKVAAALNGGGLSSGHTIENDHSP